MSKDNSRAPKRRRVSNKKELLLEEPLSDSFVFCSSDDCGTAVDIITKNLDEFALLTDSHGFQLEIKCEDPQNIFVQLVANNPSADRQKAIIAIQSLVDTLKEDFYNVDKLTQEVLSYKNSLTRTLNKLATQQDTMTDQLAEKGELIEDLNNKMKILLKNNDVDKPQFDEDSFFNMKDLKLIRESPWILNRMCDKLTKEKQERWSVWPVPLKALGSMMERRDALLSYLDGLQMDVTSPWNSCGFSTKGAYTPCHNLDRYLYCPGEIERDKLRDENEEDHFVNDCIGTVHILKCQPPYREEFDEEEDLVCWNKEIRLVFAIINKKIVQHRRCFFGENAIEHLHEALLEEIPTLCSDNHKFATTEPVDPQFSDCFFHYNDKYFYEENEKVMTWMKNNFYSIEHFYPDDYENSFVGLYNLCFESF